jgi:hypothetical protein
LAALSLHHLIKSAMSLVFLVLVDQLEAAFEQLQPKLAISFLAKRRPTSEGAKASPECWPGLTLRGRI